MCLNCNQVLNKAELIEGDYREYALLGRGKGQLIKAEFSQEHIQHEIDILHRDRKLVLVLDLDNTLIHASAYPLRMQKNERGKVQNFLIDELLDVYEVHLPPHKYVVKIRPYLGKFLASMMNKYTIFFYTAAI